MQKQFICPKCKYEINVADHIVFTAKNKDGKKGMILLHHDLGNYEVKHHENFKFAEGDMIEFSCPICHANLTAYDVNQNLARINMKDEDGDLHTILFSGIAGEKCTYVVKDSTVQEYGDNKEKYIYFVNLARMK